MAITGAFAQLDRLNIRMRGLSKTFVREEAPKMAVDEAARQYAKGFFTKQNPYGEAWPAAASNPNTGQRTGALWSVINADSGNKRARLKPVAAYAFLFHIGAPKSGAGEERVFGPIQMVQTKSGKMKPKKLRGRWGVDPSKMREIVPYRDGSNWEKVIAKLLEIVVSSELSV